MAHVQLYLIEGSPSQGEVPVRRAHVATPIAVSEKSSDRMRLGRHRRIDGHHAPARCQSGASRAEEGNRVFVVKVVQETEQEDAIDFASPPFERRDGGLAANEDRAVAVPSLGGFEVSLAEIEPDVRAIGP